MPTLLDLCGLEKDIPEDIDGRSFLPLTKGDSSFFQERILYWQWNRGYPDLYNNIAVRQGDFKLVGNCRYDADIDEFELFNIREDPSESNNLISEQRSKAIGLKGHLDNWYRQVILEEGNPKPQGAIIDMQYQDVYTLTRNDAKGTPEQWKNDEVFSYWDVEFARSGFYDITFHFYHHPKKPGNLVLKMAPIEYDVYNTDTTRNEYTLRNCYFNKGRNNLEAYYRLGFSEIVSPLGLSIRASETRKERDWNP
jgi:arylsulfatase